jgi:hypothetical protein
MSTAASQILGNSRFGMAGSALTQAANDNMIVANDNHQAPQFANDNEKRKPRPHPANDNDQGPANDNDHHEEPALSVEPTPPASIASVEPTSSAIEPTSSITGSNSDRLLMVAVKLLRKIDTSLSEQLEISKEEGISARENMLEQSHVLERSDQPTEPHARNAIENSSGKGAMSGIMSLLAGGMGPAMVGMLPALLGILGVGGGIYGLSKLMDMFSKHQAENGGGSERTEKDIRENTHRRGRVFNDPVSGNFTGRERKFLEVIGQSEGATYDTTFGNDKFVKPKKKLTDMTINEVRAYQAELQQATKRAGYGRSAKTGKGQFVQGTLKETLISLGINESQWDKIKFTPELQNRMILQNARNKGMDPNRPETLTKRRVGNEWESLAKMSNATFASRMSTVAAASTERQNVAPGAVAKPTKGRSNRIAASNIRERAKNIQVMLDNHEAYIAKDGHIYPGNPFANDFSARRTIEDVSSRFGLSGITGVKKEAPLDFWNKTPSGDRMPKAGESQRQLKDIIAAPYFNVKSPIAARPVTPPVRRVDTKPTLVVTAASKAAAHRQVLKSAAGGSKAAIKALQDAPTGQAPIIYQAPAQVGGKVVQAHKPVKTASAIPTPSPSHPGFDITHNVYFNA